MQVNHTARYNPYPLLQAKSRDHNWGLIMTLSGAADHVVTFTTILLGIFIEAAPFLLLGTVASGLVEVFVSRESLLHLTPPNRLFGLLAGSVMGFVFPVCECGVVPLTRRLMKKGLSIPSAIVFLLAAPIVNPVVLASTYAAYGWGNILWARFGFALLTALAIGVIFSLNQSPVLMLRSASWKPISGEGDEVAPVVAMSEPVFTRLRRALRIAADEFFEMGRYLVVGSVLAALMQTVVPQRLLLSVGSGPLASVLIMQVLAFVLSVCSTVDSFLSLAFVSSFTTGSILGFLVFGPMIDIKSTLMFLGVFRPKYVVYLVLLAFLMTLLIGVFVNLNLAW